MISKLKEVSISEIKVNEKDRIRTISGKDTKELEESIKLLGLLVPIIVDENYNLIAGYRRLTACKNIGWKTISAIVKEGLTKCVIELEENWKRKDLTTYEISIGIKNCYESFIEANPEAVKGGNLKRDAGKAMTIEERQIGFPTAGQPKSSETEEKRIAEIGNRFVDRAISEFGVGKSTIYNYLQIALGRKDGKFADEQWEKFKNGENSMNIMLKILNPPSLKQKRKIKPKIDKKTIEEIEKKGGDEKVIVESIAKTLDVAEEDVKTVLKLGEEILKHGKPVSDNSKEIYIKSLKADEIIAEEKEEIRQKERQDKNKKIEKREIKTDNMEIRILSYCKNCIKSAVFRCLHCNKENLVCNKTKNIVVRDIEADACEEYEQ